MSHGHLDREFTRVVGLSPRTPARVQRVRRLLEQLDVADPVRSTTGSTARAPRSGSS